MDNIPDIPSQYKGRNDKLIYNIMDNAKDLMAIVQEVAPEGCIEFGDSNIKVKIELK